MQPSRGESLRNDCSARDLYTNHDDVGDQEIDSRTGVYLSSDNVQSLIDRDLARRDLMLEVSTRFLLSHLGDGATEGAEPPANDPQDGVKRA